MMRYFCYKTSFFCCVLCDSNPILGLYYNSIISFIWLELSNTNTGLNRYGTQLEKFIATQPEKNN